MNTVLTVERLILINLVHSVVFHGVKDRTHPEHAAVLRQLARAADDEVRGMPFYQRDSALRHAQKKTAILIAPYVEENMPCAKFGLIAFYAIRELIDAGLYQMDEGAFDQAMDAVLHEDGTVTELANMPLVDRSAQKGARKLLAALRSLGYFAEQVAA